MTQLIGKPRKLNFRKDLADEVNKEYENMPTPVVEPVKTATNLKGYFYVPSINLHVAKQRSFLGKKWHECHELLRANGKRMLTLPEFVEVLKYTQKELPEVYNKITEVRSPRRAEWIDVYFELREDELYVLTGNKSHAEKIEPCLMQNKYISLDDWIQHSHTEQGFPSKNVQSGKLYNWTMVNGTVARFFVHGGIPCFNCNGLPSEGDSDLGVRAVKEAQND
jgi:hypothetical protein